jgi:hypothetical protein
MDRRRLIIGVLVIAVPALAALFIARWLNLHNSAATIPEAAMFIGRQRGCGNFSVHRFDEENRVAVTVHVDAFGLQLSQIPKTVTIEPGSKEAWVSIVQLDRPAPEEYFCNDYRRKDWPQPLITWQAVSGEIVTSISRQPLSDDNSKLGEKYHAKILLKNVKIRPTLRSEQATEWNQLPEEVTLEQIEFQEVLVGWLPG